MHRTHSPILVAPARILVAGREKRRRADGKARWTRLANIIDEIGIGFLRKVHGLRQAQMPTRKPAGTHPHPKINRRSQTRDAHSQSCC
jgi:hypothetical protein